MAFADEKFLEKYLRSVKLVRRTPYTQTDRKELRKDLEQIRSTGFATSVGQLFEGSAAISAPVYGGDGQVIAAIAIGAPADRFESELPKLREIILDVAARLSGEQREPMPADPAIAERSKAGSKPRASNGTDSQKAKRAGLV